MELALIIVAAIVVVIGIAAIYYFKGRRNGDKPSVEQQPSKPTENPVEPKEEVEVINSDPAAVTSKPHDDLKPDKKDLTDEEIQEYLKSFEEVIKVEYGTKTYTYLRYLYLEAEAQYKHNGMTHNDLPPIFNKENFPQIYDYYGADGDKEMAFDAIIGWLFAMHFSEVYPRKRTAIYKIGYEMGGYTKDSALYGWKFRCDPNICRLAASAIWAAMRGVVKPDIKAMRQELGTDNNNYMSVYYYGHDESRTNVGEKDFFVDLREFMPTAPGPYAPAYKDRSYVGGYPFPNDKKEKDYNLAIDKAVYDMVFPKYNLNAKEMADLDRTVQAIADKDTCCNHLFGKERWVDNHIFYPVFTKTTLGQEVNTTFDKELCGFIQDVLAVGGSARGILQAAGSFHEYGRLRPGCSWEQECKKHSYTDDRQNVLVDWDIEENDGNPTGYYDENGHWVYADVQSEEDFKNKMQTNLYANSYPSGHSASAMAAALTLIELLPYHADKILKAANEFANNRVVCRYHWLSDTIQGRVLGAAITPIMHCCSDFDEKFELAKKDLEQ